MLLILLWNFQVNMFRIQDACNKKLNFTNTHTHVSHLMTCHSPRFCRRYILKPSDILSIIQWLFLLIFPIPVKFSLQQGVPWITSKEPSPTKEKRNSSRLEHTKRAGKEKKRAQAVLNTKWIQTTPGVLQDLHLSYSGRAKLSPTQQKPPTVFDFDTRACACSGKEYL